MRTLSFVCLFALSISPLHAAGPENGNAPVYPVARVLQEMYSRHPSQDASVKFVVGNDLWLPRQQFKAGRAWLAFACDAKRCALEPATLSLKQEFWQGHYDDKPTFGQRLSFKADGGSGSKVVAWFDTASAQSWLKPGPVATYYSPRSPLKQPSGRGSLEVLVDLPQGESALLAPMLATKSFLDQVQPEIKHNWPLALLQLRLQNKRQLLQGNLGACSGVFHPQHYLMWAGDLDRDGKPDFLISFVDSDGPVHLYLSSAAKSDQLVGLAGIHDSPPFGGECDGPGGFMQFQGADDES